MRRQILAALLTFVLFGIIVMSTVANLKKPQRRHRREQKHISTVQPQQVTLSYYMLTDDFIASMIQIPTSTIAVSSPTVASTFVAGRSAVYDASTNTPVGTYAAKFLSIQTTDVFSEMYNYFRLDNGFNLAWAKSAVIPDLALTSVVSAIVGFITTKSITRTTLSNLQYYGKTFELTITADATKIYFSIQAKAF